MYSSPPRTEKYQSNKKKNFEKLVKMHCKFKKFMTSVEIIKEEGALEYSSPIPPAKHLAPSRKKTFKILKKPLFPEEKSEFLEESKTNMLENLTNNSKIKEKEKENTASSLENEISLLNIGSSDSFLTYNEVFSRNSFNSFSAYEEENQEFKGFYGNLSQENREIVEKSAIIIQNKWKAFFLRRNYLKLLRKFKMCEVLILLIREKNLENDPSLQAKVKKLLRKQEKLINCIRKGEQIKEKTRSNKKKNKAKWLKKLNFESD